TFLGLVLALAASGCQAAGTVAHQPSPTASLPFTAQPTAATPSTPQRFAPTWSAGPPVPTATPLPPAATRAATGAATAPPSPSAPASESPVAPLIHLLFTGDINPGRCP